jgi:hypothetical protein
MFFAYAAVSAAQKPRHPLRGPGHGQFANRRLYRFHQGQMQLYSLRVAGPVGGGFSPDGGGPGDRGWPPAALSLKPGKNKGAGLGSWLA